MMKVEMIELESKERIINRLKTWFYKIIMYFEETRAFQGKKKKQRIRQCVGGGEQVIFYQK